MTCKFQLSRNGIRKKIHLAITPDDLSDIHFIFPTPYFMAPQDWDYIKERPLNMYLKKYKKLNAGLDAAKIGLKEYIEECLVNNKAVTKRNLSRELNRIFSSTDTPQYTENSLLYFTKHYISSRKELICDSTHKRYNVFLRLLERFEGSIMKRLEIQDVNSDFVKDFIIFGKEEGYSESTIYRSIHFVKTILNFAERKGIRTAVRELDIRREIKTKEVITLNEQEIMAIRNTTLPQELHAAKDWLMVSCYTGQRFSDFMKFSMEQIKIVNGISCMNFTQQKTGKEIILPLHPEVINVIRMNKNSFPKVLAISLYNAQIRQIARLSGLNILIKARKRIGHRVKNILTEKSEVLSSHIGRRSFATNFYGKIPTPLLMEATGHGTEKMFLKYINPVDNNRIASLSKHFNEIYQQYKTAG